MDPSRAYFADRYEGLSREDLKAEAVLRNLPAGGGKAALTKILRTEDASSAPFGDKHYVTMLHSMGDHNEATRLGWKIFSTPRPAGQPTEAPHSGLESANSATARHNTRSTIATAPQTAPRFPTVPPVVPTTAAQPQQDQPPARDLRDTMNRTGSDSPTPAEIAAKVAELKAAERARAQLLDTRARQIWQQEKDEARPPITIDLRNTSPGLTETFLEHIDDNPRTHYSQGNIQDRLRREPPTRPSTRVQDRPSLDFATQSTPFSPEHGDRLPARERKRQSDDNSHYTHHSEPRRQVTSRPPHRVAFDMRQPAHDTPDRDTQHQPRYTSFDQDFPEADAFPGHSSDRHDPYHDQFRSTDGHYRSVPRHIAPVRTYNHILGLRQDPPFDEWGEAEDDYTMDRHEEARPLQRKFASRAVPPPPTSRPVSTGARSITPDDVANLHVQIANRANWEITNRQTCGSASHIRTLNRSGRFTGLMLSHLAEDFITPYTDVLVSLPTMPRGTQDIVMRCLVQHLDTAKHLLTVAIQDQIERETAVSAKDWVLIDARAPQADAVLRRNIMTQDLTSQVAEQYANFRVTGSKRSLEGIIPLDSSAMSIDKVHVCHTSHAKTPPFALGAIFRAILNTIAARKKQAYPVLHRGTGTGPAPNRA